MVDEVFTDASSSKCITGALADWSRSWTDLTFLWIAVWEYGMAGHTLSKMFALIEQVKI